MPQQDIIRQNMPKDSSKKRYYTTSDVKRHYRSVDMWVVLFDQVLDLTKTVQTNFTSSLCKPLIDYAGKDVSHWFSRKSGEPKTRINPSTGVKEFYFPDGRFLHCPGSSPETRDLDLNSGATDSGKSVEVPWWRDRNLVMGKLTQRSRKIRIINMLTHQEDIIEVPCEETVYEIQERYKDTNEHAASYTWKTVTNKPLYMDGTLADNEIFDETEKYQEFDIPFDEWYIPPILIYFNDDLTEA